MLIRSQDKKTLVNLDNTNAILIHEDDTGVSVVAWGVNINYEIGEYSSEEKAIKVLDMIQKKYLETTEICQGDYSVRYVPRATVFQMPQDSEV